MSAPTDSLKPELGTWQPVDRLCSTMRLRVPGGWLYKAVLCDERGAPINEALCFVPEPISLTFEDDPVIACSDRGQDG